MSFKFTPNPTFTTTVKLTAPGADAPQELNVTWRHKTRSQFDAWQGKPSQLLAEGQTLTDAAYLGEVIADWDGPVTDAGVAVSYTPEALTSLLNNYPAVARELYGAYCAALTESRAKN
jgi:hypothetical protein